jgi:hypothetical protein
MGFKAINSPVFTREFEHVVSCSPHFIEVENVHMGLSEFGIGMRPHLQERIDAADNAGYDAKMLLLATEEPALPAIEHISLAADPAFHVGVPGEFCTSGNHKRSEV